MVKTASKHGVVSTSAAPALGAGVSVKLLKETIPNSDINTCWFPRNDAKKKKKKLQKP